MSRTLRLAVVLFVAGTFFLCPGCPGPTFNAPPVQTGLAFTNFSKRFYAAIGVRAHRTSGGQDEFTLTPLLAPGATFRDDLFNVIGNGCPDFLDLRLLIYRRLHDDVPIGDDPGEVVEQTPLVAGELLEVPYCGIAPLVAFTMVNWDAPQGTARVKLAQGTPLEDCFRAVGDFAGNGDCLRAAQLFPNVDAAWELDGVDPRFADAAPPPLAPHVPIAGRVTLADGAPVSGIGVLLRTRFRVRLDDSDESNDPDAGFGDPIAFTITGENGNEDGAFSLDRPAGGYQVEFFSDEHCFRPAEIFIEAPVGIIQTIAELGGSPCR